MTTVLPAFRTPSSSLSRFILALSLSGGPARALPWRVEGARVEVVVVVVEVDVGTKTLIRRWSVIPDPREPPNTYCSIFG